MPKLECKNSELDCDEVKGCVDAEYINGLVDHPAQLTAEEINALVIHPDVPELTKCVGPFEISNNRTGWWTGWTPITQNANVPFTTSDWFNVGAAVTSPSCITDVTYDIDFGNHYVVSRKIRTWIYIDYRLLVNGAAVQTRTFEIYHTIDEAQSVQQSIQNIQYNLQNIGDTEGGRLNIPASATVQIQARQRYRATSSTAGSYFRYIGGLRSNASFHFAPKEITI